MATNFYTPSAVSLQLLKSDLGYFDADLPPAIASYLNSLLIYSESALREQCGIVLQSDVIYDDQLLAMYAAWVYRNRATGAGKPQMLRDEIRSRQVVNAVAQARGNEEVMQ